MSYSAAKQKISRKQAVFLRIKLSRPLSDEQKAITKKYGVKKTGVAVITDQYGNLIVPKAETKSGEKLTKQIKAVCIYIKKMHGKIPESIAKAEKDAEDGEVKDALRELAWIVKKFPYHPKAKLAGQKIAALKGKSGEKADKGDSGTKGK